MDDIPKTDLYIFQGGPENLRWWLKNEEYRDHQWFWSANKHVKAGQVAFIYLTAPLSRIVGTVAILGEPFYNPRETSMFDNPHMHNKWCAEVGYPLYLGGPSENCAECGHARDGHALAIGWHEEGACEAYKKPDPNDWPLSMASLRSLFGADWGWVRYPRGNTRIPDDIVNAFLELVSPYLPTLQLKITIPEASH